MSQVEAWDCDGARWPREPGRWGRWGWGGCCEAAAQGCLCPGCAPEEFSELEPEMINTVALDSGPRGDLNRDTGREAGLPGGTSFNVKILPRAI